MEENKGGALNIAKKIAGGAAAAVVAALLALTVYIMICNMRGQVADVFGVSIMKVVSGSMEPSIHVGDYILIKKADVSQLKEGDIICFYSRDEEIYGMPNTHRIAEIADDGSFITKGDANPVEDSVTVTADTIIGRYEGKVRFLRWLNSFASGKKLLMLLVIIPMTLVAFYEAVTIARLKEKCDLEKEQKAEEEKQRLIREAVEREKKKLYEQGYKQETEAEAVQEEQTSVGEDTVKEE